MPNNPIIRWTPNCRAEVWQPTTLDQLGKNEAFLEDVLADSPQLLGLESRRTGIKGPYCLRRQVRMKTPAGRPIRPDLILFTASGHVIVVEAKLSTNRELRDRAVIAQIIDYASSFASLTERECTSLFSDGQHETWIDCVGAMFPDDSSVDELADLLLERMQTGEINLVIACDKMPPGLSEVVSGVASQSALGFELEVVEVVPYVTTVSSEAEILFVPSTRVATEIVARTAVTVTYRKGDAEPKTEVQVTSVAEIEAIVAGIKRGEKPRKRPERLEYWSAFCEFIGEHASGIEPPSPTDAASLDLPLSNGACYVTLYQYGKTAANIGVRLKATEEMIASLKPFHDEIRHEFGPEIIARGKMGKPVFKVTIPVEDWKELNRAEQFRWFLKTFRKFDQLFSRLISKLE